jgi:hypothetical protein
MRERSGDLWGSVRAVRSAGRPELRLHPFSPEGCRTRYRVAPPPCLKA